MVKRKKRTLAPANVISKSSEQKTGSKPMPQDLTNQELIEKLHDFVNTTRISWTQLSHQLGVTQNTLTNWNKGGHISERNRRNILALIDNPSIPPIVVDYKARLEDPISAAMRKVWGTLSELDKARVYTFALECRDECAKKDRSEIYEAAQSSAGENAAEPKASYDRKKRSK